MGQRNSARVESKEDCLTQTSATEENMSGNAVYTPSNPNKSRQKNALTDEIAAQNTPQASQLSNEDVDVSKYEKVCLSEILSTSQGDDTTKLPVSEEDDIEEGATSLLPQPDSQPPSEEQLVNEVKGIYAGLVMVEKKCIEITTQRIQARQGLTEDQWQALIALHRLLLHEHHEFFLASQHPVASSMLRRLAEKYAMIARMWRHGIHALVELLRQHLPSSLEYMREFIHMAYSAITVLMECVPRFLGTWVEVLGDLARCRMAIEEVDLRVREIWSNISKTWYHEAADLDPHAGRLQHHLAILARPDVVKQLFHFTKALISVKPFLATRKSIMLLFDPFLKKKNHSSTEESIQAQHKQVTMGCSLGTAAAIIFTKGSVDEYMTHSTRVLSELSGCIEKSGVQWRLRGPEVASSLIALILDFGSEDNPIWMMLKRHILTIETVAKPNDSKNGLVTNNVESEPDLPSLEERHGEYWWSSEDVDSVQFEWPQHREAGSKFESSKEVIQHGLALWSELTSNVCGRIGDKNTIPYIHLTLAFLWSISHVPGALLSFEKFVPWTKLNTFLNTLDKADISDANILSTTFPQSTSDLGRQLAEDFLIRGLIWARFYFPEDFFTGDVVDESERTLDTPSHAVPRLERCLWLAHKLQRYMTYNSTTKQFDPTQHAIYLCNQRYRFPDETSLLDREFDAVIVDAGTLC